MVKHLSIRWLWFACFVLCLSTAVVGCGTEAPSEGNGGLDMPAGEPSAMGEPEPTPNPQPEVAQPEVAEPAEPVAEPEIVEPEVGEPEAGEPEVGEPAMGEPEVVEPEMGEPEVGEPEMGEPEMGEPEMPPEPMGMPLETPPDVWTWVDFPESKCADGSPTGLGVNLHPGADKVFVYLEGGGACWDYDTCFGLVTTALHLDGFSESTFESLVTGVYLSGLLFNREDPTNVLRDAHYVFVPYCTADVFGGDRVATLEGLFGQERTMHFHGYRNITTYLERLVPTFQEVDRVILSGSSAGGFGAGLTWKRFQDAFGDTPVDLLDDSGLPIEPGGDRWETWQEAWNFQLPPDCVDCEESVSNLRRYIRENIPETSRFGFMTFSKDTVISSFFGILPLIFEERVLRMCEEFEDMDNVHCFVIPGRLHTLLILGAENTESRSGLPLWRWIEQMIDNDPDWDTHLP